MGETITIPAGARVRNLATGRTELVAETRTVQANYRSDDDIWVWVVNGTLYEVKLNPGD